jgi:hypothetical protein
MIQPIMAFWFNHARCLSTLFEAFKLAKWLRMGNFRLIERSLFHKPLGNKRKREWWLLRDGKCNMQL